MTDDLAVPAFLDRTGLPGMVSRAAQTLASAKSAAEVLEARDMASAAYDTAKRAARLAKAKGAHDELLSKVHRAQADALEIEAAAKRKLADEYDAAQERGEVASGSVRTDIVPDGNDVPLTADQKAKIDGVMSLLAEEKITRGDANARIAQIDPHWSGRTQARPATAEEVGISRKDIHEARLIRDAEEASPGIVKATITEAVEAGEEPTRAKVRRAVLRTVKPEAAEPPPRPQRGKTAILKRITDAMLALDGLPPPGEVVGYFRGTDAAIVIDEHLISVSRWLGEFGEIWSEQQHAEAAE